MEIILVAQEGVRISIINEQSEFEPWVFHFSLICTIHLSKNGVFYLFTGSSGLSYWVIHHLNDSSTTLTPLKITPTRIKVTYYDI